MISGSGSPSGGGKSPTTPQGARLRTYCGVKTPEMSCLVGDMLGVCFHRRSPLWLRVNRKLCLHLVLLESGAWIEGVFPTCRYSVLAKRYPLSGLLLDVRGGVSWKLADAAILLTRVAVKQAP